MSVQRTISIDVLGAILRSKRVGNGLAAKGSARLRNPVVSNVHRDLPLAELCTRKRLRYASVMEMAIAKAVVVSSYFAVSFIDQDPRLFEIVRHLNSSHKKSLHSCRQSSVICREETSIAREGMRMLFNWLLKRTKCASFISRVRLESASRSGLKKMETRSSSDRMRRDPWCDVNKG